MSVANKIFTNTVWQVAIRIVNVFLGVITLAIVTRMLGQAGFGFYTTIFAFVQVFMIMADLGLYIALLREISATKDKAEENKMVNNIFTIRLVASAFVLILIPVIIYFFPYEHSVKIGVLYFMWAFFFQSLISTLTAVFAKYMEMPKVAWVDLFNKAIYVLLLIYLLYRGEGTLNQVLGLSSLSFVFAFALFWVFLKKHSKLRLAWDFDYWRKIFFVAWPLAIGTVLNLIYFKADTLVLSAYHSPEIVGLYGAPYRILEAITTFPHMFMSLILPLFTGAWLAKNLVKLNRILQHSFDFFSIIGLGLISLTWLISTPLMVLLAGKDFVASGPILNVLIVATASIFFGVLFTYLVVALGEQKTMTKYFLVAAVVGMIGYFVFIPRFSYWGAAYMTLITEFMIVFCAYYVAKKKNKGIKINFLVFNKSLLSAVVTLLALWKIKDINMFAVIILAVLIYSGILYTTKAVERSQLKELFGK